MLNFIKLISVATLSFSLYFSCQSYQSPSETKAIVHNLNLDGFTMRYYELGKGPLVVFSGGSGVNDPFYDLRKLILPVSAVATTITYERSGYGMSTQSLDPVDIDARVENLRRILVDFDSNEKAILVGHSFASLELIRFAQKYPNQVKAIVLIDGAPPSFYRTWNPGPIESLPVMVQKEAKIVIQDAEKVKSGGSIGSIPLVYFISGSSGLKDWFDFQKEFESYSTITNPILIQGAHHFIHWDYPNEIVSQIDALLSQ